MSKKTTWIDISKKRRNSGRKKLTEEERKISKEKAKERDRLYFKKYYQEHKEKILEKNKKRASGNRERIRELEMLKALKIKRRRENVNNYYRRRIEREPNWNHERYLRYKSNMTPEKREKRNAYLREWRHKKNKSGTREI